MEKSRGRPRMGFMGQGTAELGWKFTKGDRHSRGVLVNVENDHPTLKKKKKNEGEGAEEEKKTYFMTI